MLIRMMKKAGYAPEYAAALTASTAIVGPIIPPSIIMIVYALTENSVSIMGLFLGGVVPGLLIAASLVLRQSLGERAAQLPCRAKRGRRCARSRRIRQGAAGARAAADHPRRHALRRIHADRSLRRRGVLCAGGRQVPVPHASGFEMLPAILFRTAMLTASILMIVAASEVFSWVLTVGQIPQAVATMDGQFRLEPATAAAADQRLPAAGGHLHRAAARRVILLPILAPLALAAGIDPLHFAIVVIVNLTLGMVTPPVGALLFVTSIVSGVSMQG